MCMRGRGGCGRFRGGVSGVGWFLGVSKWLASDCKWMGYWFGRGITGDNSEWHRIGGRVNSVIAVSVPGFGKKCRGGWVILSHSTSGGGELKCS